MAAGAMLASCNQKEEIGEAKAVGANESYVVFAATGAPSQTLSVYADGSWAVTMPPAASSTVPVREPSSCRAVSASAGW